jgi:hypothetical protein
MSIELVPLCTVHVTMGEQVLIGAGPSGVRVVAEVGDGRVEGERLAGTWRQGAADWLVVNGGIGTVDVRAVIETDDGARVMVSYGGRIDLRDGLGAAPIHTAPRFETGHPDYAWLNLVQAVGKGVIDGAALTYEIAEVR